jgi:dethiobiotin synthetase/adenosylmethionine--8-amino-7-oxononanoate aminotransferase
MFAVGAAVWPTLRSFQIYGANTNVGKTILSTLLCKASSDHLKRKTYYLKPVSTGPDDEADTRCVVPLLGALN